MLLSYCFANLCRLSFSPSLLHFYFYTYTLPLHLHLHLHLLPPSPASPPSASPFLVVILPNITRVQPMSSIGSAPPYSGPASPDLEPPSTPPSLPSLRLSFSPLFEISSPSSMNQINTASDHENALGSGSSSGSSSGYKHSSVGSFKPSPTGHQLQYSNSVRSLQNLSLGSSNSTSSYTANPPGMLPMSNNTPLSRPSFSTSQPIHIAGE